MDGEAPTSAESLFASMMQQLDTLPADEQEKFRRMVLQESRLAAKELDTLLYVAMDFVLILNYQSMWMKVLKAKNSRRSRQEDTERNTLIRKDWEDGLIYGQLAQKYTTSIESIRGIIIRSKCSLRDEQSRLWDGELAYDIESGMKPEKIAQKYNLSISRAEQISDCHQETKSTFIRLFSSILQSVLYYGKNSRLPYLDTRFEYISDRLDAIRQIWEEELGVTSR